MILKFSLGSKEVERSKQLIKNVDHSKIHYSELFWGDVFLFSKNDSHISLFFQNIPLIDFSYILKSSLSKINKESSSQIRLMDMNQSFDILISKKGSAFFISDFSKDSPQIECVFSDIQNASESLVNNLFNDLFYFCPDFLNYKPIDTIKAMFGFTYLGRP